MAAIATPTLSELKEFYPTTGSLGEDKIAETANYVKNHVFLKMFGFEATTKIMAGTIADSASASFIGFKKLFALCVAYQQEKDPLMSTNFGSKIISRPNVTDPSNSQKSITLIDIEGTISYHVQEAFKVLSTTSCQGVPTWGGYFSYKVSKI